jgi:hypothetical protein
VAQPVFDGYGFIVGQAPSREGREPVFHVLSETDVSTPLGRRPDSDVYRRWEVAGTAHSGYRGQVYRRPLAERDLGAAPAYNCALPPFSRVPLDQVNAAAGFILAADGAANVKEAAQSSVGCKRQVEVPRAEAPGRGKWKALSLGAHGVQV